MIKAQQQNMDLGPSPAVNLGQDKAWIAMRGILQRLATEESAATAGTTGSGNGHAVHVAPLPALARLDRAHHRVAAGLEMRGGVLVLRAVAAADVPHVRHMRRWTQRSPSFRHSSQPWLLGCTSPISPR